MGVGAVSGQVPETCGFCLRDATGASLLAPVAAYESGPGGVIPHMDATGSTWIWAAGLGGAGGAVSAWLGRQRGSQPAFASLGPGIHRGGRVGRLSYMAMAAVIAAGTAAATAWMIASAATATALAFFWIGFVTAGWMAAERDKLLLHRAVCRAATAPAAHPDTVQELEHASADAVYEAVKALVPRPLVR
jgi:hypothetical protein